MCRYLVMFSSKIKLFHVSLVLCCCNLVMFSLKIKFFHVSLVLYCCNLVMFSLKISKICLDIFKCIPLHQTFHRSLELHAWLKCW